MDSELFALAEQLGQVLLAKATKLATAESCTGGWIAQMMTAVPGSSAWFDRGFVTYSNDAKVEMLDVSPKTLAEFGAVSAQTVREMLNGAMAHSAAGCAIAVTGIAGPDGGSPDKPVGTVYIAWVFQDRPPQIVKKHFFGNRRQVRAQTVQAALQGLLAETDSGLTWT